MAIGVPNGCVQSAEQMPLYMVNNPILAIVELASEQLV